MNWDLFGGLIVGGLFVIFIGYSLWRIQKYGGVKSSMMGGKVLWRVGEVVCSAIRLPKTTITIFKMESLDGKPMIGLSLKQSSLASYQWRPASFTEEEIVELLQLIEQAAPEAYNKAKQAGTP